MSESNPAYFLLELGSEHADQVGILESCASRLRDGGATVHACSPAGRVSCLEPGTIAAGMLIASISDQSSIKALMVERLLSELAAKLPASAAPKLLKISGLPLNGLPDLPDVPTVASVPRPPKGLRNALMVIQGSSTDPAQMDRYRDVILPMIKERGGYYEVFALADGEVTALSGVWTEQIFAISRWPARTSAEDFWYSDRYQRVAIPLRVGAGRFTVHLLDEV